ncbi:MAG: hypothetical protein BWK72_03425 [Rhodoferax ferrireducens]|uniref:DUF883 domain-containing protein n=1 Tax=Rhodoferax ferrireducens TaxID=192843 RepID=A0A1W9KWL0_9BURK|nr:MAG: hypothetical protein BWK72_03425 [Rhodoferax ferrireducens]
MSIFSTTDTSPSLVQQASESADHAILASQQAANDALKTLANAMQDLRHQATPLMDHASDQVSAMARHGMDSVRETAHQLRLKAERASEGTTSYIRHEPVKSVLIAAATGAALMALVSLVARSRSHN